MDETTLNQFYVLMRRFRKVVYAIKRPQLLLLDLDSTLLDTYGHQEGEGFNFHYQSHGYHPIVVLPNRNSMSSVKQTVCPMLSA